MSPRRRNWLRWAKWCGLALLLLVILSGLAIIGIRRFAMSHVPQTSPPAGIVGLLQADVPDDENAFPDYLSACEKLIPFKGDPPELDNALTVEWPDISGEILEWVTANEDAVAIWLRGTTKPQGQLYKARETVLLMDYDCLPKIRVISTLARLNARKALAQGDAVRSWKYLHALIRCSRHLGQHGVAFERAYGVGVHNYAVRGILQWAESSHVDAALLDAAISDTEREFAKTTPISETLLREYLMVFDSRTIAGIVEELNAHASVPAWRIYMYAMGEPEISKTVVSHVFQNWMAEYSKPFGARAHRSPWRYGVLFENDSADSLRPFGKIPYASLATTMLNGLADFEIRTVREESAHAILLTGLVCERYWRDNSRYPSSKQELPLALATHWPTDPFADGSTAIRLVPNDDTCLIYSVGQDGVDGGGDFQISLSNQDADFGYLLSKRPIE